MEKLTPIQQFKINNLLIDHSLKGKVKVITKLIELGAHPDAQLNSPLFNAISGNHFELVEYFINFHIDILPIKQEAMKYAIHHHATEVIKVLLKNFSLDEIKENGLKWLIYCIEYNDEETLKYLVTHKINITEDKNQLLKMSAKYGHVSLVKYFLNHDADIHFQQEHALCSACYYGHLDVIKYLVEEGANVNERYIENKKETSPLISAIDGHNKNIIEIIDYFISKGVVINGNDIGLMKAIIFNTNVNVAKKMVENGISKIMIKNYAQHKLNNMNIANSVYEWLNPTSS